MGLEYSSVIDAPLADVFGWHERPGALTRLLPPWQPVRVRSEAASLDGGRAVLALPGGVRWVAEHSGYRPPYEFTDELTSLPLRWRHAHEFSAEGPTATRMTERVDTPVPERLLRSAFAYRHRQLAEDLAAIGRSAEFGSDPLTVAVTGSRGLIGTALCALLTTSGHRVVRLVRRPPREPDERRWDPEHPDQDLLDGVDALVHLAGSPIAGRFTDNHLRKVRDSRISPTQRLAELVARGQHGTNGPRTMVAASAIGYYGPDRGDEELVEDSEPGDGFLSDLVRDWEAATSPAADAGVRVVNVRTGIVQSPRGGALQILYPLFAAGLGGPLGSGRQWVSWIGIDDLVDVYRWTLLDDALRGPVNAVAPQPVSNEQFTRSLAAVLHRPALLRVPPIAPRMILGERGATEFALAGQRVLPARLQAAGHVFRHPELEPALRHLLGRIGRTA